MKKYLPPKVRYNEEIFDTVNELIEYLASQEEGCEHICSSNCRRIGCNCKCGEFHEDTPILNGKRLIEEALAHIRVNQALAPQAPEESLAEELHGWYLEGTKELRPESYNPKAQKSYADLTEEQRDIDRFIARKILALLAKEKEKWEEGEECDNCESCEKCGSCITCAIGLKEDKEEKV